MENELKPPFIPPSNRVVSEQEIEDKRRLKRPITKLVEVKTA
jgi:hypothetical protein